MEHTSVTTPFGRRPMTLGILKTQMRAAAIEPQKAIDKWKLFRALCEARAAFGVSDRALALLNALLSFYPKAELSAQAGLVVFPSNAQLSLRAHGMAEQTIRRHLATLISAGLIGRKDSPNGKRYARRERAGEVSDAFGFNLAPLLALSDEIEARAAEAIAGRQALRVARERLTLCRRDIAKLIEAALEEGADGDWNAIHVHFRVLVQRVPRAPSLAEVTSVLEEMEMLRDEVVNLLEIRTNPENLSGNASQNERHIQNSNPESYLELELSGQELVGAKSDIQPGKRRQPVKAFPLGIVLKACPEIGMYGPGGAVASWRDLMAAAVTVRSMLGVSPSAYQEACDILGPESAAAAIACILERAGHINAPGGYLRDLTRRCERGEFSLGPMIMALLRANGDGERLAG